MMNLLKVQNFNFVTVVILIDGVVITAAVATAVAVVTVVGVVIVVIVVVFVIDKFIVVVFVVVVFIVVVGFGSVIVDVNYYIFIVIIINCYSKIETT